MLEGRERNQTFVLADCFAEKKFHLKELSVVVSKTDVEGVTLKMKEKTPGNSNVHIFSLPFTYGFKIQ